MSRQRLVSSFAGILMLSHSAVFAGGPVQNGSAIQKGGGVYSEPCGVQYVERTIYVPQWTTETRTVMATEYRPETRTKTYLVCKPVAETHDVTENYTAMVAERHSKEQSYQVRVPVKRMVEQQYQVTVPVWREEAEHYVAHVPEMRQEERQYQVQIPVPREVEQQYTAMVPHVESRSGVRQVCRTVPVATTQTVCRDLGHWQECVVTAHSGCYGHGPCGRCNACCAHQTITRRVWVPNIVQEQVPVTVYKQEVSTEPYEYQVTVCRPEARVRKVTVYDYQTETRTKTVQVCHYRTEKRTRMRKVCDYQTETRTRQVPVVDYQIEDRTRTVYFTNWVPEKRTRTRKVTTWTQVTEERTSDYTVMIPHQVQKDVQVPVCHMVPKTITVPVTPACAVQYVSRWICGCGC